MTVSDSADFRVDGHIHQLLNLAGALLRSASRGSARGGLPFGVDVGALSDGECVRWAQDLEQLARIQQAMAVQVVAELAQRAEAGRYTATGVRRPVDLLVQSLRVSAAEAHRRIRLAGAVLPVRDVFSGDIAPVRQQMLGQAFFQGELSQDQALLISGFVDEAARFASDSRISQDSFVEVETRLVGAGRGQDPDSLRRIGQRIMSHLDPDGQKPSHSDLVAKQGLFFRKPRRGLIHFDGHMTIEQHEQLMAVIGHATNPNQHATLNGSSASTGTANPSDTTDGAEGSGRADGVKGVGADTANNAGVGGPNAWFEHLQGLVRIFKTVNLGDRGTTGTTAAHNESESESESELESETAPATVTAQGGAAAAAPVEPVRTAQLGPDSSWSPDLYPDPLVEQSSVPSREPPLESSESVETSGTTGGASEWRSVWDEVPNAKDQWQERVVDGVRIPLPGSGEMLEGLDPIDPHSTDPVVKDDRTYGQKLLDGLLECAKLAARTDKLPLNGGLKAQLIIMATEEDLARGAGTGTAFTAYNGPVPLALFEKSLCDAEITPLLVGQGQEILNAGRTHRLFTPAQRKILFARDLGCSFPDCTVPAPWTEAHHVIPWQEGGQSNISNAGLLCGRHHTLIHHSDWSMDLVNGTPWFTAPYLIDPTHTPRRNTYHHGLIKNIFGKQG